MKWLYDKVENIILAIGFLTKLPVPGKLNYSNSKLADGLSFAPIIGFIIGGLLVMVYYVSGLVFPDHIVAGLILVFYVYITGGLHVDGLGDLGDGLYSGKKDASFYRVMKDSRLGTGGFLSIIFVLTFDYLFLLETMNWKVLLLLPVAGRLAMLFGAVIGQYPKNYDGSGKLFINGRGIRNSGWMLFFVLLIFYILLNIQGILIFLGLLVYTSILVMNWSKRLGGITGDMLGALLEYSQLAFLVLIYILTLTFA
jgi:adenosylcobinamide-GDP ribazoletransferase